MEGIRRTEEESDSADAWLAVPADPGVGVGCLGVAVRVQVAIGLSAATGGAAIACGQEHSLPPGGRAIRNMEQAGSGEAYGHGRAVPVTRMGLAGC